MLADSRNNENPILRQIHAMFLKLHNNAIGALRGDVPQKQLFKEARRRVCWQYQWLIRFDYLHKVCKPPVYRRIVLEGNRLIDWFLGGFSIPLEFSHAAARFGHSMVRPKYDLNRDNLDVPLRRMISEVHKPGKLDPSFAIDWRKFFTTHQPANNIDTSIPEALFELPVEALSRFGPTVSPDNPAELPIRTLYRGAAMKLPSGEQVRDVLSPGSTISLALAETPTYRPSQRLVDLGFEGSTPLWYYILLEAEVDERGAHLGTVGSGLFAEVIEGALQADSTSIVWQLKQNPKWRPPKWKTPDGEDVEIDTFLDLAVVIGLS
jgi:hypothetical protein